VTVGGFVGINTLLFEVGDTIRGKEISEGEVTIRIAEHTRLNDKEPGPWSYQELLNIPVEYLELLNE